MELDVEALIREVRRRPAIWSTTSEEYLDRDKKYRAWEELVDIFMTKDGASGHDRAKFCQHLRRRWKSLRDCYTRELKIRKTVEAGGPRTRPVYVFFNQLSFLESSVAPKDGSSAPPADDQPKPEDSASSSAQQPAERDAEERPPIRKRYRNTLHSADRVKIRSGVNRLVELETDCDRMFLLSLLGPLKQVPRFARLGVKRKLMDVLDSELSMYQVDPTFACEADWDSPPEVRRKRPAAARGRTASAYDQYQEMILPDEFPAFEAQYDTDSMSSSGTSAINALNDPDFSAAN